ncbi:uncharacterized protein [Miscanthus floridulus]|uniref:uncharacterized protein n=1 Tax=Miscanthus floridulus TaxID=154761 RepID=UPI0034592DC3
MWRRTWVRQVRDLSDGAEDCIDFVLHLDTERSFQTFCLRILPSCMTGGAVLPLDRAVCDIEQLKAMVEDVSKRNMRYSLVSSDSSGSKPAAGGRPHATCVVVRCQPKHSGHLCQCGDLGTISIARKVYEDPAFCSQFALRAWVKLRQPFDPLGFIRSLVDQFEANNSRRQQGITNVVAAEKPPEEQLVANFFEDIQSKKEFS